MAGYRKYPTRTNYNRMYWKEYFYGLVFQAK